MDFFVIDGNAFTVKGYGVGEDDFTYENLMFVKDLIQGCFDAMHSGDFSQIESKMDVDSFVNCYITHELFNILDIGWSSFYMYYDASDHLLHCGPMWDFDASSGNSRDASGLPDEMYAAEKNVWYYHLLRYDEFEQKVSDRLLVCHGQILERIHELKSEVLEHKDDFDYNYKRWNILAGVVWSNPAESVMIRSWSEHLDYMCNWLELSMMYLMKEYC